MCPDPRVIQGDNPAHSCQAGGVLLGQGATGLMDNKDSFLPKLGDSMTNSPAGMTTRSAPWSAPSSSASPTWDVTWSKADKRGSGFCNRETAPDSVPHEKLQNSHPPAAV